MPDSLPSNLQKKIEERLRYYEDIGIHQFYIARHGSALISAVTLTPAIASSTQTTVPDEEISLRKSASQPKPEKIVSPASSPVIAPAGVSLFTDAERIKGDSLLKDSRRHWRMHPLQAAQRPKNKIVFGDGIPRLRPVFVGEAPGADEDKQGIPFVGRAGKLLTQMIEAMGLQRQDVYICNVVKCRPPDNRKPEDDEISMCSPYLLRQLDVIEPKVLVCLGAVAAQTLLETNRGISQFRGEWIDWRGHKLMATYHPAYLLRNPAAKADVWKDLQKVMAELGLQLPKKAKS